jgi:hypothetical protein
MNYEVSKVGTSYSAGTDPKVMEILDQAIEQGLRVRIHYGGPDGPEDAPVRDWLEEHDVVGRVGRSMGPSKVPILLAQRSSSGGPSVLTGCIVRIHVRPKGSNRYKEEWRHPNYVAPELITRPFTPKPEHMPRMAGITCELWRGYPGAPSSTVVARGNTAQMKRLRSFLLGERMSK